MTDKIKLLDPDGSSLGLLLESLDGAESADFKIDWAEEGLEPETEIVDGRKCVVLSGCGDPNDVMYFDLEAEKIVQPSLSHLLNKEWSW